MLESGLAQMSAQALVVAFGQLEVDHLPKRFSKLRLSNASGLQPLGESSLPPVRKYVEIGRTLLPKIFESVFVWEWQAPEWRKALRLK